MGISIKNTKQHAQHPISSYCKGQNRPVAGIAFLQKSKVKFHFRIDAVAGGDKISRQRADFLA